MISLATSWLVRVTRTLMAPGAVLAALQLARSLDLSWGPLLRALREYRGEPHRVSWVRNIAGVDFIDDYLDRLALEFEIGVFCHE